ncbi:ArnT family glycosyltransferase [Parafrankia discariae]|uniref:ArnT family glycosyltransferase n=1 Tax=Parafrankia discariae TaxID=365528 RepID=UPI00037B5D4A|nr:glycosyltransferase family 39 protein [Parafrankia discariae]
MRSAAHHLEVPHQLRPAAAYRGLAALALAVVALLLAVSGRYGYHRDELYFIAIGAHPAFGYVDQPPLAPLLAHALDTALHHSLVGLRTPAALAGGTVVALTGLIARELGAPPRAQLFAAACMTAGGTLTAISHLATTSVYDLLCWTALSWLILRGLRDDGPVWLATGAVAGLALQNKTLPAFYLFALLIGVLAGGPREVLRSGWLGAATTIAALAWFPNLLWQATHGWPQLTLSRAIAAGASGTSQPRWQFLPMQFLLLGLPLAPVWITGLIRLARSPWRLFPLAYAVLVVLFLATGGKPYYLVGIYPVLFAAAAEPTLRWAAHHTARTALLGAAVVLSFVPSMIVTLPIVPVSVLHDTPIAAVNYDAGETVGWPAFADTVAAVARTQPTGTVVVTANYGEAGALLRFRPDVGPVHARQNSLWDQGPPADTATGVIVIGFTPRDRDRWFSDCHEAARIDNTVDVDNDEQGRPVDVCAGPRQPWSTLWPRLRRYG